MRHLFSSKYLGLTLLVLLIEYALSPFLFLLNGRPDLLYLVVLDYAFFWSWDRVPFFAMLIGLVQDFFGGHLFGIEIASFSLTGWVLSFAMQKFDRGIFWVRMVVTFLFVALTETLSIALGASLETSRGLQWSFVGNIFTTAFYTTLVAPAFFWFTDRWFGRSTFLRQFELF